jgi:hypothetical protein
MVRNSAQYHPHVSPEFAKRFDPESVELFKMFSIESDEGIELYHFRKASKDQSNAIRSPEEHTAAVESLRDKYEMILDEHGHDDKMARCRMFNDDAPSPLTNDI